MHRIGDTSAHRGVSAESIHHDMHRGRRRQIDAFGVQVVEMQ